MFEWDEAKSRKLKAERGASFEELEDAIADGHLLGAVIHAGNPGQELWIVRLSGAVWVVVVEHRGRRTRLVTAYPSRKWRKKYG